MIFCKNRWFKGLAWGRISALILVVLIAACTTTRLPGSKKPVGEPTSAEGPLSELAVRSTSPPVDPVVIAREINRRQEALKQAREIFGPLAPGQRREVLGSWIQTLEAEISGLEAIRDEVESWPSMGPPSEQAEISRRVTERLMECVALSPLETCAAPLWSRMEQAPDTWESVRLAYRRGDCAEALGLFEAQGGAAAGTAPPADIQVLRALCLSRSGKYSEGIEILEALLQERTQLLDVQYLHYLLANWLFQESLLDRAGETYQSVLEGARERDRWSELARLRINQIRLQRGEPLFEELPAPFPGAEAGQSPADIPLGVDRSAEAMPAREPPTVDSPTWEPVLEAPTPPEEATVPSIYELRDARLMEAQQFMDNEQYEDAVVAYQALLGTEYDTMAQEGIQRAQDLYAEKQRREAAALVLKAHGKSGARGRKELLVQALRLLQDINARYPGNRYAAKVQQNIRDVIEQIHSLDPDFDPYPSGDFLSREGSLPGVSPR